MLFLKKNFTHKEKCRTVKKQKESKTRYHKISLQRKFIKYKFFMRLLYFGTLELIVISTKLWR